MIKMKITITIKITIRIKITASARERLPPKEANLLRVIGGGHTWPGGRQYLGKRLIGVVSRDINASEMILDFFSRRTLGTNFAE